MVEAAIFRFQTSDGISVFFPEFIFNFGLKDHQRVAGLTFPTGRTFIGRYEPSHDTIKVKGVTT